MDSDVWAVSGGIISEALVLAVPCESTSGSNHHGAESVLVAVRKCYGSRSSSASRGGEVGGSVSCPYREIPWRSMWLLKAGSYDGNLLVYGTGRPTNSAIIADWPRSVRTFGLH